MRLNRYIKAVSCTTVLIGVMLIANLFLQSHAFAAFEQMPTSMPDAGPEHTYMVVSSGDRRPSARTGNLLFSPQVWLKVYSKNANWRQIYINSLGGINGCYGARSYTFYKTTANEGVARNNRGEAITRNLGNQGLRDCSNQTLTIPRERGSTDTWMTKSNLAGHKEEGLYTGLINIVVSPNSQRSSGPQILFKARVQSNAERGAARLGTWSLYGQGEDVRSTNNSQPTFTRATSLYSSRSSGKYTYNVQFRPSCTFWDQNPNRTQIKLNWFDDDFGAVNQPRDLASRVYNQTVGRDGIGSVAEGGGGFRFAGPGAFGSHAMPMKKDQKYTWQWQNVQYNNGLVLWYPFDSGDYYTSCPATENWNVQPKLTKNRGGSPATVGFNNSGNRDQKIASAKQALRQFSVSRSAENNKPRSSGTQAKSGEHRTQVQYRVYDRSRGSWSNYQFRFDGANWTDNLNPQVEKNFARLKPSWGTSPPVGASDGPLYNMLRNPEPGDRYCEILRTRPANSTGSPNQRFSQEQCVRLVALPPGWSTSSIQEVKRISGHGGSGSRTPESVARQDAGERADYSNAWVGERYELSNTLINNGPDRLNRNISVRGFAKDMGSSSFLLKETRSVGNNVDQGRTVYRFDRDVRTSTAIQPSDADDEACTYIDRQWVSSSNRSRAQSNRSCVSVPWYYSLKPKIEIVGADGDALEQGDSFSYNATINNPAKNSDQTRFNTNSQSTGWNVFRSVQEPGETKQTLPVVNGTRGGIAPHATTEYTVSSRQAFSGVETASYPIGTQLCVSFTLATPESPGHPDDYTAREQCRVIAKYPKVQFQNGDVKAGLNFAGQSIVGDGNITTTGAPAWAPSANKNMYGSWVEYGAFARGEIRGFGSSATPSGMGVGPFNTPNTLTFANTNANLAASLMGGSFASGVAQPDYFTQVTEENAKLTTQADLNGGLNSLTPQPDKPAQYIVKGNATIKPEALTAGKDVTIYAQRDGSEPGTITIEGNITYPDNYGSLSAIPRLKIIAEGDIIIKGSTARIDAWLIAKGRLRTCDTNPPASTATAVVQRAYINACNQRLTVNGPISVGSIGLYRTYGADATKPDTSEKAAEVFNVRPDQILTNYLKDNEDGSKKVRSVYEKDLPPRY